MLRIVTSFLILALFLARPAARRAGAGAPTKDPREAQRAFLSDVASLPGTNAVEKLQALFQQSETVTREDLVGWHIGRSFFTISPTVAYSGLLIGADQPEVANGGPLFGTKFVVATFSSKDPTEMDHLTAEQRVNWEKRAATFAASSSPVVFTPTEASMSYMETNGKPYFLRYRRSGGYIIEELTVDEKLAAMSYFFMRVPQDHRDP